MWIVGTDRYIGCRYTPVSSDTTKKMFKWCNMLEINRVCILIETTYFYHFVILVKYSYLIFIQDFASLARLAELWNEGHEYPYQISI